MEIKNRMFRSRPVDILFLVNKHEKLTISGIFRNTHISYAHISNLLFKYHRHGLVSKETYGREVIVRITTKGVELVNKIKAIYKILDGEKYEKIPKMQ